MPGPLTAWHRALVELQPVLTQKLDLGVMLWRLMAKQPELQDPIVAIRVRSLLSC